MFGRLWPDVEKARKSGARRSSERSATRESRCIWVRKCFQSARGASSAFRNPIAGRGVVRTGIGAPLRHPLR